MVSNPKGLRFLSPLRGETYHCASSPNLAKMANAGSIGTSARCTSVAMLIAGVGRMVLPSKWGNHPRWLHHYGTLAVHVANGWVLAAINGRARTNACIGLSKDTNRVFSLDVARRVTAHSWCMKVSSRTIMGGLGRHTGICSRAPRQFPSLSGVSGRCETTRATAATGSNICHFPCDVNAPSTTPLGCILGFSRPLRQQLQRGSKIRPRTSRLLPQRCRPLSALPRPWTNLHRWTSRRPRVRWRRHSRSLSSGRRS
jgi:hypothetical protein